VLCWVSAGAVSASRQIRRPSRLPLRDGIHSADQSYGHFTSLSLTKDTAYALTAAHLTLLPTRSTAGRDRGDAADITDHDWSLVSQAAKHPSDPLCGPADR